MTALYTIGNFTIDDIVLHDGRLWIDQAGGNVLYSALGARVWLDQVGMIARLGNDLPEHFLSALNTLGLDLALVPTALPGILTGVMLAVARAAGETAPLLFTALFSDYWLTRNPMEPTPSLAVLIFDFSSSRRMASIAMILVALS